AFNPGLEEVLDPNGTVTLSTAKLFEITNNDEGPFKGFKFQFTSTTNNGNGDFVYVLTTPFKVLAGTIDSLVIRAHDGTAILQVTAGPAGFGDQKLDQFYNRLT